MLSTNEQHKFYTDACTEMLMQKAPQPLISLFTQKKLNKNTHSHSPHDAKKSVNTASVKKPAANKRDITWPRGNEYAFLFITKHSLCVV